MGALLITGGSRGIGREVALQAAKAGFLVAILYNSSEEKALDAVAEIKKAGGAAMAVKGDVTSLSDMQAAAKKVVATFGKIDALVTSAGVAQQKLFTDITEEDWRKIIDVNLTGTFNAVQAVLPCMISQKKGRIVTVSSMWGETGASCEVHYSAAKAGVIGMTKALAKEVAMSGVEVNCVSPGAVMTDMLKDFSPDDLKNLAEETPLMRIGTADDVAKAVMFFLTSSSFITGEVLRVNGGLVI